MNNHATGKDLTKEPPRSPRVRLGGFAILSRTIDKCRAELWGKLGEYEFNCELDNYLFGWKGLAGLDFKAYVAEGHSDEEILAWVKSHGIPKTDAETEAWSDHEEANRYDDDAEGKAWLQGKHKELGLPLDSTLFDYLEADDAASFKK